MHQENFGITNKYSVFVGAILVQRSVQLLAWQIVLAAKKPRARKINEGISVFIPVGVQYLSVIPASCRNASHFIINPLFPFFHSPQFFYPSGGKNHSGLKTYRFFSSQHEVDIFKTGFPKPPAALCPSHLGKPILRTIKGKRRVVAEQICGLKFK